MIHICCASQDIDTCSSLLCITYVSVEISIHYTYHLVAAFITSWCHVCIKFYLAWPRRESTTNHASVTVMLHQLSHTESFLLAWDYSKIFCSIGPNANMNSSTALLVHEFIKSRALFPIFHTAFKCGAVFWCNWHPVTAQSKEMLNKMIGQECGSFSFFHFTG